MITTNKLYEIIRKYYKSESIIVDSVNKSSFKVNFIDSDFNITCYEGFSVDILNELNIFAVSKDYFNSLYDKIAEIENRNDLSRQDKLRYIMPLESEIEYYMQAEKV